MQLRTVALSLAGLAAAVNAHFQLQFPAPRGVFVEDNEPNFCDSYNNAVSNRTVFPLSGGFVSLNSEHPKWTIGAIISTVQDPTSFNDFNFANGSSQLVLPFQQENVGEGMFCLPLNLNATGISGIQDGANVTIQLVFDGGDGQLYQCADLTLSANATVPAGSDHGCKNLTEVASAVTTFAPGGSASGSATATSPGSSASGKSSGAETVTTPAITGLLALLGAALAVL